MIFLRVTLIVFSIILFIVGLGLYRIGIFKQPTVLGLQTKNIPLTLVQTKKGSYHETVGDLQDLVKILKKNSHLPQFCFAQYLDDPDKIPFRELRSEIGCAFAQKLPLEQPWTQEVMAVYHWSNWEPKQVLVLLWPSGPALGSIKVYPTANQWFNDHKVVRDGYQVLEIYPFILDDSNSETTYWFPVKK